MRQRKNLPGTRKTDLQVHSHTSHCCIRQQAMPVSEQCEHPYPRVGQHLHQECRSLIELRIVSLLLLHQIHRHQSPQRESSRTPLPPIDQRTRQVSEHFGVTNPRIRIQSKLSTNNQQNSLPSVQHHPRRASLHFRENKMRHQPATCTIAT